MFNKITWKEGEALAKKYMQENGYKIIFTNFQCVGAELDIVAILPRREQIKRLEAELKANLNQEQDKQTRAFFKANFKNLKKNLRDILVITEVKARSNSAFGTGLEAVDKNKVYHMKRGADVLLQRREFSSLQVRFDIASVDDNKVTYYENAF